MDSWGPNLSQFMEYNCLKSCIIFLIPEYFYLKNLNISWKHDIEIRAKCIWQGQERQGDGESEEINEKIIYVNKSLYPIQRRFPHDFYMQKS